MKTPLQKEIEQRKSEIETSLELLFKGHMKITDWDVPEVDDKEAATMIIEILEQKLASIKKDLEAGVYDNY